MKDKYTFDDDGSLLKNGQKTVCPKAPLLIEPNRFNPEQAVIRRMPCSRHCPFMQKAKNGDKNGIGLFCMEKRIFIETDIDEKK
jgi:hypothetical protein